ncbi:MAG TPA: acylphosphatase [Pirellulaceae bacterium]|jgi:acylphosphatase
MTNEAEIQARRVLYSGHVQGVGFRYTAQRIAQQHAVTGFVKNLRDGCVELVAEGTREELDRLLCEIAAAMEGNIEAAEAQSVPVSARFRLFEIVS